MSYLPRCDHRRLAEGNRELVRAEDPVAKVAQALIPQGNRLGGASACSAARSAEWLGAAAAGLAAAPVTMVAAPISAASARHPGPVPRCVS